MSNIGLSNKMLLDEEYRRKLVVEEYAATMAVPPPIQPIAIQPKGWSSEDTIESVKGTAALTPSARKSLDDQWQVSASTSQTVNVSPTSKSENMTPDPDEVSDSFIDAVVSEFYSWGSWLWNTINPWATTEPTNTQEGSNAIDGKNKDGSVNPFANRRTLSNEERAQYRKQIAEMNKLFDKLHELLGDDQFEAVMFAIIQESIRARKEGGELIRDKMVSTYEKKIKLNKEQQAETEKLFKSIRNQSWFTLYDEVATTVGLSAAAALTIGSGGWGVVALVYAVGTAYNRYNGHIIEKQIGRGAGWLSNTLFGWNANKIDGNVSATLKTGTGLMNAAITLGLGKFGNWITVMMQGTSTIINLHFKMTSNKSQSRHFELGEKLKKENKALSGSFKKQTENLEQQNGDQKIAANLLKQAEEIEKEMIRG